MKYHFFNKIFLIFLLVISNAETRAQKYIVFEKHNGLNSNEFKPGLMLSQNEISLKALDTNLSIFNWYFTPKLGFKWSDLSSSLPKTIDNMANQVLITAVPLIIPKANLELRKLSPKEFEDLKITSKEQLLEQTLKDFYFHFNQRKNLMPPLKTIEYGLIIKDKQDYYLVKQQVLVSRFILRGDQWYFPNEFKSGVLNINPQIKTYQLNEILAIEREMKKKKIPYTFLDKIYNRIFASSINYSSEFNEVIFNFWEYLSDDVISSTLDLPKLHEFNLGLGSFEFLANVGVINCTLDSFIKRKISFNNSSYFNIISINSVKLSDFKVLYKDSKTSKQSYLNQKN